MVWTYAGFEEQSTDAARLAMLRQHITEVSAAQGPELGADGKSRSTVALRLYLQDLHSRRKELEQATGSRAPGLLTADFRN